MCLLQSLSDVVILVNPHLHSIALLSQRILVNLLSLLHQLHTDLFMLKVLLACQINLVLKVLPHISVEVLDIEFHVLSEEILELSALSDDVFVDSEESWDLSTVNMHQVFIWQVFEEDHYPISSMLSQSIENTPLLLNAQIGIGTTILWISFV